MKYIVCNPDGYAQIKELASFDEIRAKIGGWIEVVHPKNLQHPFVMMVDEEGLLKNLDVNIIGTLLYGSVATTPIVGTIVIGAEGIVNGEPDIIGLTDMQIKALMSRYFYYMEELNND